MSTFKSNIFPMNSLQEDPNLRGGLPLVVHMVDFSETLSAGIKAIDDIPSPILLADVISVQVGMKSGDVKTDITGVSVIEAGASGSGYLKITLASSKTDAATAKVGTLHILGRITPQVV